MHSFKHLQMKSILPIPSWWICIWKSVYFLPFLQDQSDNVVPNPHPHSQTLFPSWHSITASALLRLVLILPKLKIVFKWAFKNLLWSQFWQTACHILRYFGQKSPSQTAKKWRRGAASKYGESRWFVEKFSTLACVRMKRTGTSVKKMLQIECGEMFRTSNYYRKLWNGLKKNQTTNSSLVNIALSCMILASKVCFNSVKSFPIKQSFKA